MLDRRRFLLSGAVLGGSALIPSGMALAADAGTTTLPTTTISGSMRLPQLDVPAGTVLAFNPAVNTTVELSGNAVVAGTLRMRPNAGVTHVLRFVGIDETKVVGGGMEVLQTDVGLWVTGHGQLDLAGAPKTAWSRAAGALKMGQTAIQVANAAGWRVGDQIAITPTGPVAAGHHARYDERIILGVQGNVVTVAPLTFDHPTCVLPDGRVMTSEVLNLSRSVRIEGTRLGRAHVMVLGHAHDGVSTASSQYVENVELRHLAPGALGRYGLHFHRCGAGAVGSTLKGIVARDVGNHAFVGHLTDGLTWQDCISHNTLDEPYWWDPREAGERTSSNQSNGITYRGCVASKVSPRAGVAGHRLTGFSLEEGAGNRVEGCVAVGIGGSTDAAGFSWPEGAFIPWAFIGNVSHNNARHGIFTWQNTGRHEVGSSVAYRNGQAGVSHGAYSNGYRFTGMSLVDNGTCGVLVHAVSDLYVEPLTFVECTISGSPWAVLLAKHRLTTKKATQFVRCSLSGRTGAMRLPYDGSQGVSGVDLVDLVDCTYGPGPQVQMDGAGVAAGSIVRQINAGVVSKVYSR